MFKKQIFALSLFCCIAVPALAWTTVNVRSGQTVSGIVTKYSPSSVSGRDMLTALQNENPRLAKYGLQVGMTLKVPTTVADVRDALGGSSSSSSSRSSSSASSPRSSNNSAAKVASTSKQLSDCQTKVTNLQQALNNQTQNVQLCQAKLGDQPQNTVTGAATGIIKKSSGILSFADLWFFLWLITFILLWRVHLKYRHAMQRGDHRPRAPAALASASAQNEPAIIVKKEPQVDQAEHGKTEPDLHHVDEMDLRQVELDIPAADAPAQTQIPFTPSFISAEDHQEWAGEQQNIIDAIANDHDNIDWHIALLEFYIKTRNEGAYQRHMETMIRTGLMAEGDPLWERVRKMYLNAWIYHEGAN